MIVYNDFNRKGKASKQLTGFMKRDYLVTFSKISLLFFVAAACYILFYYYFHHYNDHY